MDAVAARVDQIQLRYAGYFHEPVFHLLGNPALLYRNLLLCLRPYGADIQGLQINLAALADAHVSCFLPSMGIVRVSLDHVEVFVSPVRDRSHVEGIIEAAWHALAQTDSSISLPTHEGTLSAWLQLRNQDFESYIGRFVDAPAPDWKPAVQFSHIGESYRSSILLEESDRVPGGLFARSVVRLDGAKPVMAEILPTYVGQLQSQLQAVDLKLEMRP